MWEVGRVDGDVDGRLRKIEDKLEELWMDMRERRPSPQLEILVDSTPMQAAAAATRLGYRCTAGTMVIGDPKPEGGDVMEWTHLVIEGEGEDDSDVLDEMWDALRPGTMLWRNPTIHFRPFSK